MTIPFRVAYKVRKARVFLGLSKADLASIVGINILRPLHKAGTKVKWSHIIYGRSTPAKMPNI